MATSTSPAKSLRAAEVLEREFLELRARLLQVGAQLDRIDRAGDEAAGDPRIGAVKEVLSVLAGPGPGRAEQVQMIFSRPYDAEWKAKMELQKR
jgi:hypothetical protein